MITFLIILLAIIDILGIYLLWVTIKVVIDWVAKEVNKAIDELTNSNN